MKPVEQAAIVLLSMGEEPASAVLRCLDREELLEVTQVMSRMSGIKVDAVKQSIQKFFSEYREQSGVHGASRSYLKRSLDLALGSDIASSVLNNIYGDAIRPKMAHLQWVPAAWLAERIANEHVRMQAVFLSFLPSAQASQVIAALPEEGRDLLLINIARLTEVERELLVELEQVVDGCLQNLSMQSANVEGVRQAAEIINRLPGDRAQMVELLRAHDPDVVNKIESNMYDFYILCKQTEAVLTRIVEAVDMEQWAIALKGVEPEVRNALLQSMPRRQAQAFEEQVRRIGPVPLSRVHQVRQDIMVEVRNLALSGEIDLQLFAEDVVE